MMTSTTEEKAEGALCGSPPSNGPRTKHQRLGTSKDGGNHGLPAEVWGKVMEFLPLGSVLSSAVVSREMLRAMPFVKMIHVDHSSQMHAIVASRHSGVTEIRINSLLNVRQEEFPEGTGDLITLIHINRETSLRAIPFLTRFVKQQRVVFKPRPLVQEALFDVESDPLLSALIESIAAAYRCGAFSREVQVSGLSCPKSLHGHGLGRNNVVGVGVQCATCIEACRSFPLKHAISFEWSGSSIGKVKIGRPHGLEVCMKRKELQRTIEDLPGSREMLYSQERFLKILGDGTFHELVSPRGRKLRMVKFGKHELDEIKRFIANSPHDVTMLPPHTVHDAIIRSFTTGDQDVIHPMSLCYLAHESFSLLKDEFGLQMEEDKFYGSTRDMVEFFPQLVNEAVATLAVHDSADILEIYARLMRHLVESEGSCKFDPKLAENLVMGILGSTCVTTCSQRVRYEVMLMINFMIEKWSSDHIRMLVGSSTAKLLASLFDDLFVSDEDTELGLSVIHRHFISKDHIESLIQSDCVQHLLEAQRSENDVISNLATECLCRVRSQQLQDFSEKES